MCVVQRRSSIIVRRINKNKCRENKIDLSLYIAEKGYPIVCVCVYVVKIDNKQ